MAAFALGLAGDRSAVDRLLACPRRRRRRRSRPSRRRPSAVIGDPRAAAGDRALPGGPAAEDDQPHDRARRRPREPRRRLGGAAPRPLRPRPPAGPAGRPPRPPRRRSAPLRLVGGDLDGDAPREPGAAAGPRRRPLLRRPPLARPRRPRSRCSPGRVRGRPPPAPRPRRRRDGGPPRPARAGATRRRARHRGRRGDARLPERRPAPGGPARPRRPPPRPVAPPAPRGARRRARPLDPGRRPRRPRPDRPRGLRPRPLGDGPRPRVVGALRARRGPRRRRGRDERGDPARGCSGTRTRASSPRSSRPCGAPAEGRARHPAAAPRAPRPRRARGRRRGPRSRSARRASPTPLLAAWRRGSRGRGGGARGAARRRRRPRRPARPAGRTAPTRHGRRSPRWPGTTPRARCAPGPGRPSARPGGGPGARARKRSPGPPSTTARPWLPTLRGRGWPSTRPRAFLHTRHGTDRDPPRRRRVPLTTVSFVDLARAGFYDGLVFHRVEPGFVVQGGCPRGDGNGGPGFGAACEVTRRPFGRGAVGIALSGKDTGGSQLFITLSPQPHLDGVFTLFGQVVRGMEVVERIRPGDAIERVEVWTGRSRRRWPAPGPPDRPRHRRHAPPQRPDDLRAHAAGDRPCAGRRRARRPRHRAASPLGPPRRPRPRRGAAPRPPQRRPRGRGRPRPALASPPPRRGPPRDRGRAGGGRGAGPALRGGRRGLAPGGRRRASRRARRLLPRARGAGRAGSCPTSSAAVEAEDPIQVMFGGTEAEAAALLPALEAALGGDGAYRAYRVPGERAGPPRRARTPRWARRRRSASCRGAGASRPPSTLAIGDNWNDREMIESAGLGFVMANADPASSPSGSPSCPRTTRTGWRGAIEEHVLGALSPRRERVLGVWRHTPRQKSGGRDLSRPPQLPRGSYFFFLAAFFLAAFFFAGIEVIPPFSPSLDGGSLFST